ncbi:MAG: Integrase, catalytic region [Ferruginibacter sp.]|nr:Integrase, catalytic region [Ferruginibacter sp.]
MVVAMSQTDAGVPEAAMTTIDVVVGQTYSIEIADQDGPILVEFIKEMRDGRLRFEREGTDREIYIDGNTFEFMRCSGAAVRVTLDRNGEVVGHMDPDPVSLLDPEEPSITVSERKRRLVAIRQLKKAKTLRHYVRLYDDQPDIGRGHASVDGFVAKNFHHAFEIGFDWRPDAATILRAVDRHGMPQDRPLCAFFDRRGKHDRLDRWPMAVTEAAEEMVLYFWSHRSVRVGDAIAKFTIAMVDAKRRREERGRPVTDDDPFEVPVTETLRLWIRDRTDWYHWASKYGKKEADRRFKGRGRAIEATRPLEYVMIDHTIIDAWAIVLDEDGDPVLAERPCLTIAVDCYSRMVVGAVMTFDRPGLLGAMSCIRQVARRKDWLIEQFGSHGGATDGWGRPFTVIVDNGWEFIGSSFQTACEAAGIDVIWAPVKVPMFKAYVERLFGTLNTLIWHDLPGGIPMTPQQRSALGMDPKAEAAYTKSQLEDVLWHTIVTVYHMEQHSGIEMAPADKWRRGLRANGRPTVDDVSRLDKVVGRAKNCKLTAEGIAIDGLRFHDPKITSGLMNRFARFAKERGQRAGVASTRSVDVLVTSNPGDASQVFVWDHIARQSIRLPSWDPDLTNGLSWAAVKKIKEFAKAENLRFRTPEETAEARVQHKEYMRKVLAGKRFADARKMSRLLDPTPDLVPGNRVAIHHVGSADVQHDMAIDRMDGPFPAAEATRRGGAAATRKAKSTAAANREAARKKEQDALVLPASPAVPSGATTTSDLEAIRALARAKMIRKN